MKNAIFIIAILFFNLKNCVAQHNSITSSEATINDNIVFKETSLSLIGKFGPPINIEDYFFEMENLDGQIYHYPGLSFFIINSKVDGFEITSNQYNFSNHDINVGDNINTIQPLFPSSYENKMEDEIIITLSNADYYIIIKYDNLINIILSISLNVY